MSYESAIRGFLVQSFGYRGMTPDLGADVPLLDQGILDSTGVLEIAQFFENELGVVVADEDMIPDNFGSVSKLVAYVTRKKGGA